MKRCRKRYGVPICCPQCPILGFLSDYLVGQRTVLKSMYLSHFFLEGGFSLVVDYGFVTSLDVGL